MTVRGDKCWSRERLALKYISVPYFVNSRNNVSLQLRILTSDRSNPVHVTSPCWRIEQNERH